LAAGRRPAPHYPGAVARNHVAARYGWDHQLDRLEAMYDRVTAAG